ncbi:MAG: polyprenyl synthetase family protein [Christensenellaceae bacterium]
MMKTIELINNRLKELMEIENVNPTIRDAMNYSLMAGGKRIRPVLNIMANSLLNGDAKETLDIACAIEMIHTYSLIHDDLPAMDDDDLRRGKPTSHVMFGEAFAILAGDGLLNYAYEVMLKNALKYPSNLNNHTKAILEVATGAGVYGMITGQCGDIENEGQILTEQEIIYVHKHKTGDMIKSALVSGLLLCSPSQEYINALSVYGYNIGLTFQIVDDVLDITGDAQKMGKTLGKDKTSKKFTFPTLYGVDESMRIAVQKTEEAVDALSIFGSRAEELKQLAGNILKRDF